MSDTPNSATSSQRTQNGFTLLELLIVLVIAALAVGIVLTRATPRNPGLQARLAAAEIAQGLRLTRGRAIQSNRPVGFVVDIAHHSWRIDRDQSRALPPDLYLGLVTVTGETAGASAGEIVFAPDGSSTGGRVELARAGTRLAVGVDWLTGRVTLAEFR